jgi:hypothetical protein
LAGRGGIHPRKVVMHPLAQAYERELTGIKIAGRLACADAVVSIVRKVLMRRLALAILAIMSVSAAGPARAQTYDPAFPFCMHMSGVQVLARIAATIRWTNAGHRRPAAASHVTRTRITWAQQPRRDDTRSDIAASIESIRFDLYRTDP